MIYFSLRFNQPVALLFLVILSAVYGFWAYRRLKKNLNVSFLPIVIFNLLALGVWAFILGGTHDEIEHLHASWLVSQGMIPYKDFWQHHSPFLWLIIAPFIRLIQPSADIINISRLVCGAVLILNIYLGWKIACAVWGKGASFIVYMLVISSILLLAEFLLLRPDVFMLFFLLLGIRMSLEIQGKNVSASFLAGLAFAMAASFMLKQYFLVILPLAAIFIGERRLRLLKVLLYLGGLILGACPLVFYLITHGILKDYFFWVFEFNGQRIVFSAYFQLGITALACWGGLILFKRSRESADQRMYLMFMALCLSTLCSLTMTSMVEGSYYLGAWFFIAAIVASGCDISGSIKKIQGLRKLAFVYGIVAALFLASTISNLILWKKPSYSTDRAMIGQMINYCAGDNCLAFLPAHPIFSHDTTRLYSLWQYAFIDESPLVKKDLKEHPIAEQIITARPAIVLCRYLRKDLFLDLFQKDLLSVADYKKLVKFFKENYTQSRIGKRDYYIRNDKL